MLEIQTKRLEPDIVVLELAGKLTLGRDCKQLEWAIDNLIHEQETKVIFDLSGVTRIDSTGIGILVMSAGQVKKSGGQLRLAAASGHIQQVLLLSSVDKLVPLHPTAAAAAAEF